MHPEFDSRLTRSWRRGIVIISVPGAEVPTSDEGSLVTSGAGALVVRVPPAQHLDGPFMDGDWHWTTATIHVSSHPVFRDPVAPVQFEGVLSLPEGTLTVGDADGHTIFDDLPPRAWVRVQADDIQVQGASEVWIDFAHEGV